MHLIHVCQVWWPWRSTMTESIDGELPHCANIHAAGALTVAAAYAVRRVTMCRP